MADKKHETIVFSVSNYNDDLDKMFEAITTVAKVLLNEGYVVLLRYDEPGLGIAVMEFEHDDNLSYWGVANPIWLTPEEIERYESEGDEPTY